ncbi:hypothetical protein Desde_3172 [Desulfitobacterium dehalogenans ATCC 51507]|uniref:Uncharacterized protein n=1 Tax=Desulfitobacterium dehalogenans (strain ATCC 51507 / DSM 9161 / JW/IU-DC1) TaxID=756499 RepID=I4ABX8_DESDJ|nr:hypothetical protein [Desulfitobacterium dehalogenans]AFM01463.1 hypothetical protein Desde_3172 [Desulfitobacterium dehalogenans ATCC 51507]
MDNWATLIIIVVVVIGIGLIINSVAPGAVGNWFNNTLQNLLNSVPSI